ncbi:Mur ligase family protein [Halostagnicola bangensis]
MSSNTSSTVIPEPVTRLARRIVGPFTRGTEHRRRLDEIDVKIVVSGTRGKSGTTERIYDVLRSRGYDAYAKVTGNHPLSLYDGDENPIDRGERVTLYENFDELRKYAPVDALVLENQGITDYTTRMMNEQFGKPDVLVLTNVRQDHRDTLGGTRADIARAFARATPAGTHVVNGEQDSRLREYIERELETVDATVSHVDVPERHQDIPAAECIYGLDHVLAAIDEEPLSDRQRESMLEGFRVEWTRALGGRVYNAADVNDVESTEMVRQALVNDGEPIQPFVYLRRDRRARTASFHDYLGGLFEDGAIEQARVAGGHADLFAEKASFPVISHDTETESARSVLEEMVADGWPVLVMGNTVAEFMRDLDDEIDRHSAPKESADTPNADLEPQSPGKPTDQQLPEKQVDYRSAGESDDEPPRASSVQR